MTKFNINDAIECKAMDVTMYIKAYGAPDHGAVALVYNARWGKEYLWCLCDSDFIYGTINCIPEEIGTFVGFAAMYGGVIVEF